MAWVAGAVGLRPRLLQTQAAFGLWRNASAHTSARQPRVALVLSGCGVYDGTEVHEASACLVHLSRHNAEVQSFAPTGNQQHVVNHVTGQPSDGEHRDIMVESARIARGKVAALSTLKVSDYDAVIFPGGFGAAKNLCSFAFDGTNCKVKKDVLDVLHGFHTTRKPIGLCCIAPVLAAKVISGCEVTVGFDKDDGSGRWPYAGTAAAVIEMGAKHINKNVTEVHVDTKNLLVTTPAFMCNAKIHEVFDGIGEMVAAVLSLWATSSRK